MTIAVNWTNPYEDRRGEWLRGNLHAHTSPASPCSQIPLGRVLDLYARKGLDFLSVSDHMCLTEAEDERLILIPGVEWNARGDGFSSYEHTGIYSLDDNLLRSVLSIANHDELLQYLAGKEVLVVLNHPNWEMTPHYRREQLARKEFFDGLEIFNGVVERVPGYAISTDKWDFLLSKGKRVLGFSNDDSHDEDDVGWAWNCVRAASPTAESILDAVRKGNFYCSSGVNITDIRKTGDVIEVETEDAQEIRVLCDRGLITRVNDKSVSFSLSSLDAYIRKLLEQVKDPSLHPLLSSTVSYVRVTAYGSGSSMAWTQPFFLK